MAQSQAHQVAASRRTVQGMPPAKQENEDYTVDEDGNGTGNIMAANGDFYNGGFKEWKRHGYGEQVWVSGEEYKGTWHHDQQLVGIFFDRNDNQWQGNFMTKEVALLDDKDKTVRAPEQQLPPPKGPKARHMKKTSKLTSSQRRLHVYEKAKRRPPKTSRGSKTVKYRSQTDAGGSGAGSGSQTARAQSQGTGEAAARGVEAGAEEEEAAGTKEQEKPFDMDQFLRDAAKDGLLMTSGGRFKSFAHKTPGPAAYSPNLNVAKANGPRYSMGMKKTAMDGGSQHGNTPGPGNYQIKDIKRVHNTRIDPIPLLAARPELVQKVPGPGAYFPQASRKGKSDTFGTGPTAMFGTAHRDQKASLSKAQVKVTLGHGSPGPAQYHPADTSGAPLYTMGARRVQLMHPAPKSDAPGPGTHNPRDYAGRALPVAVAFSKASMRPWGVKGPVISSKHAKRSNAGMHSPGPAAYDGYSQVTLSSAPKVSFRPHVVLRAPHMVAK